MQLHTLTSKTKRKKSVQIGRGGKRGKTSGRGMKGQKARAGSKLRPEMRDIIKKIPKLRGRGKNSNLPIKNSVTITLAQLESRFEAGDVVTHASLNEKKLVNAVAARARAAKILKTGTLSKKLSIQGVSVTKGAKEQIESAGGTVA